MTAPPPDYHAVAGTVQRALGLLRDGAVRRAERASRPWSQRGYPTATIGSGVDSGTPDGSLTERIALSPPREAERLNPDLLDAVRRAELACADIARLVLTITARPSRTGRPPSTATVCANQHCGDLVLDGLVDGRCKPCARYRRTHDRDAPPRIIATRERMRAARAQA